MHGRLEWFFSAFPLISRRRQTAGPTFFSRGIPSFMFSPNRFVAGASEIGSPLYTPTVHRFVPPVLWRSLLSAERFACPGADSLRRQLPGLSSSPRRIPPRRVTRQGV